ncbi:YbaN family protein [Bacteriovorax sp. PP10]|uniref:YbaN family protein n=1 Tax=Bacteriovorax antarcticus TaxID=3088717 RepID=A0ABU5VS63_9BACT|nr:YbaN family protein [Bacteriovorax sp. PP10]MEA9355903.1 YbaN family protein [Bacteriovorax sp. PP10]
MKKIVLLTLGHFFLALGIVGAFLPVLPTTPFLLLAAYFYSKSSEKIHNWLMNHKYLGPSLKDWHERGVIGIKSKWVATIMLGLIISWRIPTLDIPLAIKIFASSVLVGVLVFIWTRPSSASKKDLT